MALKTVEEKLDPSQIEKTENEGPSRQSQTQKHIVVNLKNVSHHTQDSQAF